MPHKPVIEHHQRAPKLPACGRHALSRRDRRHRLHAAQPRPRHSPRGALQGRPVRVRPALRGPAGLPLRHLLLPRGDAVHPVRHRGDLPLPGRGAAQGFRHLRAGRDDRLHRAAGGGVRLRVAARSARMAVTREPLDDFRIRQLRARDMLRGDLDGPELERHVEEGVLTTTLDKAVDWARGNSLFPLTFGLACCAIEFMTIVSARVDVARFGFEALRASPRQADLLVLSGRVSIKMAPIVRRIYDQMLEPKWSIAMGACASSMGVFNNYAIVPADKFMPVDVHVPGCPPRPEALMHGVLKLRAMIQGHPDQGWRQRYGAVGTEEVVGDRAVDAINVFGPGDTQGA